MAATVSEILERRASLVSDGAFRRSLVGVWIAHVVLLAAWVATPLLTAKKTKPIEFVAVQIVPAARLAPAPAPKPPAAKPEPPPKKPPPVPEAKPKIAAPVLVDPKKRPEPPPKPAPQPEPPAAVEAPPAGNPAGAPAAQQIFGVAGLDNPTFTYGYYVDQMLGLIYQQWVRPPVGSGVEMMVHFEILKSGQVADLQIVRSSGINSFDLAGLRAVQAASPLPPLPSSYKEGRLGVNLIIR